MKEEDLLLKYCNYNSDFLAKISNFPEKNKILTRLEKETCRTQFLSTISELYFGKLFHELTFNVIYEKEYSNKQTPDWTISLDSEYAICDVYRLGKSKTDQNKSDFEYQLIEEIECLNYNVAIRITFNNEYFDTKAYDVNSIINALKNWLFQSENKIGNKLVLHDMFSFEILEIDLKTNNVCCCGNVSSIDYKPQKVIQYKELRNPNEITKKLIKYNTLIEELSMPYFIAVDIDFISGFDFNDFIEHFRGRGNVFIDYGNQKTNVPEIDQLGKEWTELGEFYRNSQLSGFILRYNNDVRFLLNPLKSQIVYQRKKILSILRNITCL